MFTIVGIILYSPVYIFMLLGLASLPQKSYVEVYLNSLGGDVDIAYAIHNTIKENKLYATCYVELAASATLQIIMPACSRIYVHPDTVLQFHDAHHFIANNMMLGIRDLTQLTNTLTQANLRMQNTLESQFGPARCPHSTDCTLKHIWANTKLGPHKWNYLFPESKSKLVVIPKELFDRFEYLKYSNQTGGQDLR